DRFQRSPSRASHDSMYRLPESLNGRPRNSAAFTSVNTVALAPMPRARATTATTVYQRSLASRRNVNRRSCSTGPSCVTTRTRAGIERLTGPARRRRYLNKPALLEEIARLQLAAIQPGAVGAGFHAAGGPGEQQLRAEGKDDVGAVDFGFDARSLGAGREG